MKLWAIAAALVVALLGADAEAAKRLGGGKSMGKQSSNVTQREAAQSPGSPTQGAANAVPSTAPKAAPGAAAAPHRPWGAMFGGLAAGLGLAWLASSLGLGEAFGQILLFGLLALLIMVAVGWFMRSRRQAGSAQQGRGVLAFQGASAGPAPVEPTYRPEQVGNDASARPWERSSMAFQAPASATGGGSMIGSALMGSQSWGVPTDFDSEGFLRAAKSNFVTLQSAWDRSDIPSLRTMMTDAMLAEIKTQLAERESHTGAGVNLTEVVMLDARLLGIEELADEYMASVEFSGMIREEPGASPNPFREVWNLTKRRDGRTGWLVAGVQALQ